MKKEILVTRATLPPLEEYIEEIKDIWDTHWLTNMGKKHNLLEAQLKEYLDVNKISLFCNGHMALELLIQAMNIRGEVITTPFTFASTTHAIVRNGLTPVFCDINADNYTIDVNKIEALITKNTAAILPVHVYGNVCDVESIQDIAKRYNLKVIYDAAHAFGVKYHGKGIGNFGDATMYSFHATKVYNTIEGGGVAFSDELLEQKLYQLKNFGIKNQEEVDGVGANAKMNEFQAAMGICNLRYIEKSIAKRKEIVDLYRKELKGINGIKLNEEQPGVESNYAYMPIYVQASKYGMTREGLMDKLEKRGYFPRKYFYPLTNEFACYKNTFMTSGKTVAKEISQGIMTMPLYEELEYNDVMEICEIIRNGK